MGQYSGTMDTLSDFMDNMDELWWLQVVTYLESCFFFFDRESSAIIILYTQMDLKWDFNGALSGALSRDYGLKDERNKQVFETIC